jgi:Zn-dependent M28 family amino/carboxypeptidase
VRRQAEIGPRPSGSPELEKARAHIEESLGRWKWRTERQEFTDQTPRGPVKFVNVIGRFTPAGSPAAPGTTQQAIVASHYDTKRFTTIRFAGANDGASSTGALLELARVLSLDPALAAKVELVFFDGEEAVQQFTDTDGLYGSRYYALKLGESGRARQFKFGIVWDMIGDRDLTITLPPDSIPDLAQGILSAAEVLGLRKHFSFYSRDILDDHVPLIRQARIPTIDLIDFDYPYWHTADDTLEKLSPESIQKIGAVTLYYLKKALP